MKCGYLDMHEVPEDERIRHIGEKARTILVGVLVDDEPDKVKRYIEKVTTRYPDVRLIDQHKGPTPGVRTLRFGPKVTQ